MALQLVVVAGPDTGRTYTLQNGPELMLGRGANSQYRLTDPRASRAHCQLLLQGDKATVIDNGSTGGTLVNGAKVTRRELKLGDIIQVGDSQMRLQMGDFPLDVALSAIEQPKIKDAPAAPALDQLEALAGQKLSHYDITHVIGKGTTSIVFHATDENDQRSVALKVLLPEFAQNEEDMQRFVRAVKTMLPLKHANLVSLYGAGKSGPHCWVAMEYVAGENMAQIINRIGVAGMLDWRYAYRVAMHVARALAYAHSQDIIHRNVTPTNILMDATNQIVKLGDLMLAKALEGAMAKQITRPGELVGDVEFMSPERTRGMSEVDGRSDLYGLGATVYALLTGRPPFTGDTLIEKITRIRQTTPELPTKSQMSIPSMFEGIVMRLLAKKPEDRFQTAESVIEELTRVGKYNNVSV